MRVFTEPHRIDRFQLLMCLMSATCAVVWCLIKTWWLGVFWLVVAVIRAGMSWKRRS